MSMSQEKSNATVMPVPDADMVSDGEDEQVVNLEAVAREAKEKLKKDLADTKAWNDEIMQKKQEWMEWKKEVEMSG